MASKHVTARATANIGTKLCIGCIVAMLTLCQAISVASAQETVSLRAVNQGLEDHYVRHRDRVALLQQIGSNDQIGIADATFIERPARDGTYNAVSSYRYAGY